jgi:ubiquinone/menaquinone biosynthesis C-methylase UbiE
MSTLPPPRDGRRSTRAPLAPWTPLALLLLLAVACVCPPSAAPEAPPERPQSVAPGINESYLDPELDVERFVQRFETESREIYLYRENIVAWVDPQPGERIADVGAGTGLFSFPFAEAVGNTGRVDAVEIAPAFVEHLESEARRRNLPQLRAVLGAEDDILLPAASIDKLFTCDTYHHFEYPEATLASIHRALVPGGRFYVIDFERIEGISRPWVLGHVRAGREVFQAEIEAAGFELIDDTRVPGLEENYSLIFVKR